MDIRFAHGPLDQAEADTLVVFGFEKFQPVDLAFGDWMREIYSTGEFAGKIGDTAILYQPAGLKAKRLVLAGAGSKDKLNAAELRKAAGAAARSLKSKSLRRLHFAVDRAWLAPGMIQAAVEGALLGDYEPDQLKTDPKKT